MTRALHRRMSAARAALNRPRLPTDRPAPVTTFDKPTHTYTADGVVYPSVTQVLVDNLFVDYSMVPNGILARAQFRGNYVHEVLHLHLVNDYDLEDCAPEFRGYVDSGLAYLATLQKQPLVGPDGHVYSVEARFWHHERRFAGAIDYLGVDADGVVSIDDFKSGSPVDVAAALQTAAYEAGVRACILPGYDKPIRRRAIKLFADGQPARVEVYTDPRDLAMFYMALSCTHFRRNRCRHAGGSR